MKQNDEYKEASLEAALQFATERNYAFDTLTNHPDVTRVEVIDRDGRAYTKWDVSNVQLSMQDSGKTLKVFLTSDPEPELQHSFYFYDTERNR